MIYAYIKQHYMTNLKYFGQTTKNPHTYHGSGKIWKQHCLKYGKQHINTLEIFTFNSRKECIDFCRKFSIDNNIVESPEWANIRHESGSGNVSHTDASKAKMRKTKREMYRGKNNPMYGKIHSEKSKDLMAQTRTGKRWVHEPMTNIEKCIPSSDFESYIEEGWVEGRSISVK
jgi:hypothetical protein